MAVTAPGAPANALGVPAGGASGPQSKAAEQAVPVEAANALRSSTAAPANEVEEFISTPSKSQVGQAWIRQMPPGSFVIQHTVVPSYGEGILWLEAHRDLRRARILAIYLDGQAKAQFAIVSGPFASIAEAANFALSNGLPKDRQIRSTRAMKERFAP
jgi:septal ring-binding cell division protein DamX